MTILGRCALSSLTVLFFSTAILAQDISPFTSDGCSLFPDGNLQDRALWCDCCLEHDLAYWQGGTKEERKQADVRLRGCVQKRTKNKALAELMYDGVRAGGHPAFPMWYRWGYGWNYGRGYRPLTEQEQENAKKMRDDYFAAHPKGYCAERHGEAAKGE